MTAMAHEMAGQGLSIRDYRRLAGLLNAQLGIKLPDSKRIMLEGRLRPRMRQLGLDSYDVYCELLHERGQMDPEWQFLVDAVTTNKTDFFREPSHFDQLSRKLLPSLLAGRSKQVMPLIKLWSAACSNGAEPYTAAMVLEDARVRLGGFRFAVLGTDISTRVLTQGVRAIYPVEAIQPVPAPFRDRYLLTQSDSSSSAEVRIVPELRRVVRFARMNLMDRTYPFDTDVDIIFLRNVLIYFEKADQDAVTARLMSHLRPGGFLILGHSEAMIGSGMGLRQIAPAVFVKE